MNDGLNQIVIQYAETFSLLVVENGVEQLCCANVSATLRLISSVLRPLGFGARIQNIGQ